MAKKDNNEKIVYAILFLVSVGLVIYKIDALISFLTNAILAALGIVGTYFFGKKWLELNE